MVVGVEGWDAGWGRVDSMRRRRRRRRRR